MDTRYIPEPELQFGAGTHADIRFGLMNYGPLDAGQTTAPDAIRVGLVGTPDTTAGVAQWFEKCSKGIAAKPSRLNNLFARFPGFGEDHVLSASVLTESTNTSTITDREIRKLFKETDTNKAIEEAVNLFLDPLRHLSDEKNVNVLICAPPKELWELIDRGADDEAEQGSQPHRHRGFPPTARGIDFHDLLKARGLALRHPIQVIWPPTYSNARGERKRRKTTVRSLQDEATRAWNIYTALYYKAKGVPWRLIRDPSEYATCYVGVSFFNALDNESVQTSVAQVFNERGEGLILKGGPAVIKEDRVPHLSGPDAQDLLARAVDNFRREHKTNPARIVLHKTSGYSPEEKEGFWEACDEKGIELMDLLHLRGSKTRFFRTENYPPLRGTFIGFDQGHNILYTRGSIDLYRTFPGRYPPKSLEFEIADAGTPPHQLAEEILKLTKMSWNNTQIDNLMPVTIEAARGVSDLLRYAPDGGIASSYRHYM